VDTEDSHADFRLKKCLNVKNKERIPYNSETGVEDLMFLIKFSGCLDF